MPAPEGLLPGSILLVASAVVGLATKTAMLQCVDDGTGKVIPFIRPWTITFVTFVGLFLCWVPPLVLQAKRALRKYRGFDDDVEFVGDLDPPSWRDYVYLAIPAMFQVLGVTFSTAGLAWTTLSIYQMLRASLVIFGAIFSVAFLKRRLFSFHVLGIGFCVVGIVAVGGAGMMARADAKGSNDSISNAACSVDSYIGTPSWIPGEISGLMMLLLGQMITAAQFCIEESFLRSVRMPPLTLCGVEALWGLLAMVCIVMPSVMLTPTAGWESSTVPRIGLFPALLHEDFLESWRDFVKYPWIMGSLLPLALSVAVSNAAGIKVTQYTSAMHRVMVEAARVLLTWALDTVFHCCIGNADVRSHLPAETWGPYSFVQAVGLVFLVGGMIVYNRVVDVPCLSYPSKWTLREHQDAGTLPPLGVSDAVWHLGDAEDRIRLGYYGRIGVGAGHGRRCVRFRPGYTIINGDEESLLQNTVSPIPCANVV